MEEGKAGREINIGTWSQLMWTTHLKLYKWLQCLSCEGAREVGCEMKGRLGEWQANSQTKGWEWVTGSQWGMKRLGG